MGILGISAAAAFVLSLTGAEKPPSAPLRCPNFSATVYTVGAPAKGFTPFKPGRCKSLAESAKRLRLKNLTFVFEHYGFKVDQNADYHVTEIPQSELDPSTVEQCFDDVFESGLGVHLKIQLPDGDEKRYGKFIWRHHYQFDAEGEYFEAIVQPYLSSLLSAKARHPQKDTNVMLVHEAHHLLCVYTDRVVGLYQKVKDLLKSEEGRTGKIPLGISLDWSFFKPGGKDSPYKRCIPYQDRVGQFLASDLIDFIGIGAYSPGGGWNGKVGSAGEGERDMRKFFKKVDATLVELKYPKHKAVNISEWNGGGREPNAWEPPNPVYFRNAFEGTTNFLLRSKDVKRPMNEFVLWNVRSSDEEWLSAIEVIAKPLEKIADDCSIQGE